MKRIHLQSVHIVVSILKSIKVIKLHYVTKVLISAPNSCLLSSYSCCIIIVVVITTCYGATQPVLSSALEQYSVIMYTIYNIAYMYMSVRLRKQIFLVGDKEHHASQCCGCKPKVSSTLQVLQQ